MRLSIFGSVARGDNSSESDIDLLADFDRTRHYTLATMGRLEIRLADMLGTQVDLSSPEWLRESIKGQAFRESVLAFQGHRATSSGHSRQHQVSAGLLPSS
jgi:predicted nucleotidyltransferase